jgi:hypothetical protein
VTYQPGDRIAAPNKANFNGRNEMAFNTVPDDLVTDDITINCRLGEEISVCASPGRVVVEIAEQRDCTNAHLTIGQGRQLIRNIEHAIAEAERLAVKYPDHSVSAVPVDAFRKTIPGAPRTVQIEATP